MITISHNEIVVACRKAFEAKGFRLGQAEDGAEAIGWLAVHGLPLPEGLLTMLGKIKPPRDLPKLVRPEPAESIWDVQGAIGMSVFPNLADYASVQALQEGKHQLTILNCGAVELIWPYLSKIQKRDFDISIRWPKNKNVESLVHFPKNGSGACIYRLDTESDLALESVELMISREPEPVVMDNKGKFVHEVSIDKLQENYLNHTENGIDIDEALWERLIEMGKGLLVESTAESEKRGAGGV